MNVIERELFGAGLRGRLRLAAFNAAIERQIARRRLEYGTCVMCGRTDCPNFVSRASLRKVREEFEVSRRSLR